MKNMQERRQAGAAMKEFEEVLPALSRRQILDLLQELRGEGNIGVRRARAGDCAPE
jgi:hypothetical protein